MTIQNMYEPKCLFCNNNDNAVILYNPTITLKQIKAEFVSTRARNNFNHYRILKCKKCNLIYSNPVLDEEELAKLYKDSSTDSYSKDNFNAAKIYFSYFKKFIKDKNKSILEIGCGNGDFLKILFNNNYYNIYGLEPAKLNLSLLDNSLKERIINKTFSNKLFSEKSFDVICAFMVLEHILKPDKFLIDCRNILKSDGCIILVVHNINSYLTFLLGEKNPIINLGHIYYFSPQTIKKILTITGYKNIKIYSMKNTYTLNYWIEMLPLNFFYKNIAIKTLKKFQLNNIELSFKVGNLFIYAER